MATATTKKEVIVQLTLTEFEAQFIMQLVQNPWQDDESSLVKRTRESIWNAIQASGIKVW